MHVLLSGLHHEELLLLADLLGQNTDLLHLLVLAVIVRVVLPGAFLQLLLFLQIFQFLQDTIKTVSRLRFNHEGTSWPGADPDVLM